MSASIVFLAWPNAADVQQFFATLTWPEIKHVFNVGKDLFALSVYFLAAIAAIGVLRRLPQIIELVRAFRENSNPIWALLRTTEDLKQLVPAITEKLQALQTQVVAIQRNEADNRTAEEAPSVNSSDSVSNDDREVIRKMWTEARDQLEKAIDDGDGRRTRKYAKIPRYDYADVIATLLADGFINKSIADDAQYMNTQFKSLQNRKRPITEEIKSEFARRKKNFDEEIRHFTPQLRTQTPTVTSDASIVLTPKKNGAGNTAHAP